MSEFPESMFFAIFLPVSLLSAFLVYCSGILAGKFNMLDVPGDRQSHSQPTATGGGIGMIAALILSSLLMVKGEQRIESWHLVVLPGLAVLSIIGWIDDRKPVSAVLRLLVQLSVSFSLVVFLAFGQLSEYWQLSLVGGVAIVWIMNAYNFMDGSHGMAGFQGVFSGILLALVFNYQQDAELATLSILLVACCVGFLPFNFPRPKIFMGDSGSVPLGYAISALLLLGISRNSLEIPVAMLVLAVFLVDSSLTLFNRVIRGERWYTSHKQHMYQRLIGQGWPHSRVLLIYQAINIILVVPAVMLVLTYPEYAWLLTGTGFLILTVGWYTASLRIGVHT